MRRIGLVFAVLILAGLWAAGSLAAEKSLLATIDSIDAAKQVIVVDGQTLDVVRKTEISVNGKTAVLADLKAGQTVAVVFDRALEVALSITVADNEATVRAIRQLQGAWRCVAIEDRGTTLDEQAVLAERRHMTVQGNKLTMERHEEGRRLVYKGKMEIDGASGAFDFIGKGPRGGINKWIGIYELKDDTLKLCYRYKRNDATPRPAEFKTDDQSTQLFVFLTFHRDQVGVVPEKSNDPEIHFGTAWSDPDHEPVADAEARFQLDQSQLDTEEWQEAIRKALNHQSNRGYYTLLRVTVDDLPDEQVQAQATKLKEFTEEYNGAGGEFRVLKSGEFLLWEHINSDGRRNERDPLQLGAVSHGHSKLWVEVPKARRLNVLGDVILERCPAEERGALSIKLHGAQDLPKANLMIGPVMVGGPYGTRFPFDPHKDFELHLPPGKYKLLLPDFDLIKSRWDVTVTSQETTRMEFDVDVPARSAVKREQEANDAP